MSGFCLQILDRTLSLQIISGDGRVLLTNFGSDLELTNYFRRWPGFRGNAAISANNL